MGIIYHAFCKATGKAYVGQTWNSVEVRWKEHQEPGRKRTHLRSAIQRYGADSFVLSVLTQGLLSQSDMDSAESYWIDHFDAIENGYNLKGGGSRGRLSAATKTKLSLANKRRFENPEERQKISIGLTGKVQSCETRQKRSLAMRRKILTPEHRLKLSEAKRKMYPPKMKTRRTGTGGFRPGTPKCRAIVDDLGIVYESVGAAGRLLGVNRAAVRRVLQGKNFSCCGRFFKYLES